MPFAGSRLGATEGCVFWWGGGAGTTVVRGPDYSISTDLDLPCIIDTTMRTRKKEREGLKIKKFGRSW